MTLRAYATAALGLAVLALALPRPVPAQQAADVQIQRIDVAPGIYMLLGQGGNIGVSAGADGVFIVDDQYAPLTDKIIAVIREVSDAPIRFVINTHWHEDHTNGNENLGEAGALIVAHDNVRKRLSVEQFLEAFGRRVPPAPEGALPVVTFSESVTFHLNDEEISGFHVALAHTDGDAIIHFRNADVVHMGDIYFNGMYPFIDLSSRGSIHGMIGAAETVLAMIDADTKIIPGHGPLSNRAELREYRDMLVGVRDAVAALIAKGMSEDEVVAGKPTARFDAKWGEGFLNPELFTRIVYKDLSRKR